jgi:predicted nucleotidyltransferase
MSREEIQNTIVTYLSNYNPEFVGLFGSFARKENSKFSDIDVLVRFQKSYSLLQLIKMENELSDKLGIKVDLVTAGSLQNKRIKDRIMQDILILFQA